jgi:integrase
MAKQKSPNVKEYWNKKSKCKSWMIDVCVRTQTGSERVREFGHETREQAEIRLAKIKADAYEGRSFKIEKSSTLTVKDLWEKYAPKAEEHNDSWKTDKGRAAHLLRHLGPKVAMSLTSDDVVAYRTARRKETTVRGGPPSPATQDREIELLQRFLNDAVAAKKIPSNPIAHVPYLRVPNVRQVVVQSSTFDECLAKISERSRWMVPILTTAYDTGMRISEVLGLLWTQIDLPAGRLVLDPSQTKAEDMRTVILSERVLASLRVLQANPWHPDSPYVFPNPKTGKPRTIPRKGFARAFPPGVHIHDLRRSFATEARRAGVAEGVVMRLGGWKTRAVFDRYAIVQEDDLREAQRALQVARGLVGGPKTE